MTLETDAVCFAPCLPEGFGTVRLEGLRLRGLTLDLQLSGSGSHVAKMTINGNEETQISFKKLGHYDVKIVMSE
ncbi:MAG: hypothetical protein IIY04_06895 [Oscillospiraceae bacterium]|nr:hypothetical protein [Oscillospiraceae bacterium]